ncbi:hypothetical protein M9Y10_011739 [Tritrichomonas musculus]|uniref:Uncharacterized protein n=1 Tax=Tritrichomonas musculus TaxID=1915356 RepID=A0ABR2IKZ6_9EUKA
MMMFLFAMLVLLKDAGHMNQKKKKRPTFDEIATELKTNPNFIEENVDKEEFFSYAKFIDEAEKSFYQTKSDRKLDEALSNIHELYEIESMKEFKNFNFDLTKFELLPGKIVNNDVYNICEKETLYEKKKNYRFRLEK